MKVTYVSPTGEKVVINASEGDTLMYTAVANNVGGIIGECGGSMMCATCHVYVEEAYLSRLPAPSEGELELLACVVFDRRENSRLSCQIRVSPEIDGIILTAPERQQ